MYMVCVSFGTLVCSLLISYQSTKKKEIKTKKSKNKKGKKGLVGLGMQSFIANLLTKFHTHVYPLSSPNTLEIAVFFPLNL